VQRVPVRGRAFGVTGSTVACFPRALAGAAFLGAAGVRVRVTLVTLGDDTSFGALGDFAILLDVVVPLVVAVVGPTLVGAET